MTTEPADLINASAVSEALAAIGAIPDPVAREKAARDLQDALTEAIAAPLTQAKGVRRNAVLELRQTLTLAKVAERLGLSTGRVDQIAKGK
ncbi:RNA polymerase subunit sigma-70 [Streptomyces sp. IBSBF 2950]|uniref:RNA polymerase subunit sigma-70 n=1 Tax=Streptomyces sp. IBSBF 2950 TaxID=2903528 RepID=UPI002FDBC5EF